MKRGRDPSLEIGILIKEGEKIHREEDIPVQEIDPDFQGTIGHSPKIDMILETTEEGVLQKVKIEGTTKIIGISPGTEAKRYTRDALLADVKIA